MTVLPFSQMKIFRLSDEQRKKRRKPWDKRQRENVVLIVHHCHCSFLSRTRMSICSMCSLTADQHCLNSMHGSSVRFGFLSYFRSKWVSLAHHNSYSGPKASLFKLNSESEIHFQFDFTTGDTHQSGFRRGWFPLLCEGKTLWCFLREKGSWCSQNQGATRKSIMRCRQKWKPFTFSFKAEHLRVLSILFKNYISSSSYDL